MKDREQRSKLSRFFFPKIDTDENKKNFSAARALRGMKIGTAAGTIYVPVVSAINIIEGSPEFNKSIEQTVAVLLALTVYTGVAGGAIGGFLDGYSKTSNAIQDRVWWEKEKIKYVKNQISQRFKFRK